MGRSILHITTTLQTHRLEKYKGSYLGVVVNNHTLNSTISNNEFSDRTLILPMETIEPVADSKRQLQQWTLLELERTESGRERAADHIETVFAVWFSLWGVWWCSRGECEFAQAALRKTMDAHLDQLDLLAKDLPQIRVILPEFVVITFLPTWRKMRTAPRGLDLGAGEQRNAVLLVEQWNEGPVNGSKEMCTSVIFAIGSSIRSARHSFSVTRCVTLTGEEQTSPAGPWTNFQSGCPEVVPRDLKLGTFSGPVKDMRIAHQECRFADETQG